MPTLAGLTPDDVERHLAAGGVVVDARPAAAFAAGHVPGSLSNTLRPVFASWLGWLVEPDQRLVFVLDPGQDRADLVRQCLRRRPRTPRRGARRWNRRLVRLGRQVNTVLFVDVNDMAGAIIDVRQANEYASGHVPARNVELGQITAVEPTVGPVTVMCGHGERAMTGASLLAARGVHDVVVLDGGPDTGRP
ncbi:MAG: rhodanese-like domain-containing protein [Acidimicrobiales bacterium]